MSRPRFALLLAPGHWVACSRGVLTQDIDEPRMTPSPRRPRRYVVVTWGDSLPAPATLDAAVDWLAAGR